jgi:hypothetical protein
MKKLLPAAAALWLLFPAIASAAGLFAPEEKEKMMQLTLESFWGKALDSQGKPVQPKDEAERARLPISREQALYLIDKGGESGLAQWCGVAWQGRYQLLIEQLRRQLASDTQVAYAGVLHGLAQHMFLKSVGDERCDDDMKNQTAELIRTDVARLGRSLKQP